MDTYYDSVEHANEAEAIAACLEGRERAHRMSKHPWPDVEWWERISGRYWRVDCICGWMRSVDTRKRKVMPEDVFADHVTSEASRPPRAAPRNEELTRMVEANRELLQTPVFRLYGMSWEEHQRRDKLIGYINNDYEKEQATRPPTQPPRNFYPDLYPDLPHF